MARGRKTRGRAAAPPPEDHDSSDDNDAADAPPPPAATAAAEVEHQPPEEGQNNANDESMEDGMEEESMEMAEEETRSRNNGRSDSNQRTPAAAAAAANNDEEEGEDDSVLKILLSTDNHLGYNERDAIRGRDSFAAFEEVLSLARHHKADMVLLSGDLFHDNKPSRKTLHTTMEILRRYCMGGESVGFQIVSDQKECLRSIVSGRANYEDEFYSVDLPIFTIHGNHDDPTRDGGESLLSAVDLLSVSNLVNYFGRQDEVDHIKVSPVLLQKGETKVALYGMGSMRDERLNRMWQSKKVKFLRPDQNQTGDDDDQDLYGESNWFNIFTLHQNRDLGRGSKNCVHESMIPEWMDLVVWGHEHECLINASESLVGTFRITQPGSSVATSLTAGESRRKHVGLLEIKGQQFRLKPIPLSSVRSFAVGDVSLGEKAREQGGVLDVEDPKVEERMSEVLVGEVEALIQKARDEAEHLAQDAEEEAQRSRALEDEFDTDKRERKYKIKDPEKVLVRLKVEHTGFTTLNNQRFGSQFVGEVANPSDILLFHKRRQADSAKGGKAGASKKKRGAAGMDVPMEPEDLADINIEDLVNENLVNNEKKLELLDEKSMGEALEQFVEKKEPKAISIKAAKVLEQNQKILMKRANQGGEDGDAAVDNPTSVREFLSGMTGKKRADYEMEREEEAEKKQSAKKDVSKSSTARKKSNSKDDDSLSGSEDERPTKKKSRVATTSKKAATAKSRRKYDESDEDFDDSDDAPPPKKRATAKKATTSKARPRRAAEDSGSDIEFVGTSQVSSKKPAARSSRAARTTVKKPKYTYNDSDVEEIDDDDSAIDETPKQTTARGGKKTARSTGTTKARAPSQTQSTMTSFTSTRKPAASSRGRSSRNVNYLDSDSDDEPSSSFGGGGAWGSASQSTKARGRR